MVAYSASSDLLTGSIPTPAYLDLDKVVQDAADEIDSKLGHIYTTPFDVSNTGPLSRPARLLLKRINNFLATGRLILQVASPEEDSRLHAYGWSLIQEANAALAAIAAGEISLTGAQVLPPVDGEVGPPVSVPLISNLDPESNVEAFYDRVSNPNYSYGSYLIGSTPDGFVR